MSSSRRFAAALPLLAALALCSPSLLAQAPGDLRGGLALPVLPPAITLWYGTTQSFGAVGNPVPDINLLGNVSATAPITALTYTLNGGPQETLSIGPDTRRLERYGDFNIDIPTTALLAGANRVIITAVDNTPETVRETVTVNYTPGRVWPLPYAVNWGTAGAIPAVAQVVDGRWRIDGGALRTEEPGYDRFVAIGDRLWSDYEVTVPVTVFGLDSSGFQPPSNGCGIGFLMRWPGHSDLPAGVAGWQPKTGFLPLGALSWYEWRQTGARARMIGNGLGLLDQDSTGFQLAFNTEYMLRMRVETVPGGGGRYRMKIWQSGSPEPTGWLMDGQASATDPQQGSLLLTAHHVDARFGDVTVLPVAPTLPSPLVSDDFSAPAINTGLWTLVNPAGDAAFALSGTNTADAWLNIIVPGGNSHQPWTTGNGSPRAIQPAGAGDFSVEAKFESPLTQRYQLQGIQVLRHDSTYMRFEFFSDAASTRAFAATLVNNVPTTRLNVPIGPPGIAPLYMRVHRSGDGWLMQYSFNGTVWTSAASFPYPLEATGIGPYAGNFGSPAPAFTGLVDYFFNTAAPIIPEDPTALPPLIVTQPGDVTRSPGQTATFSVTAAGTAPLAYQWQEDGVNIPGATGPAYTTPPLTEADDGSLFRCRISNAAGSVTTRDALLRVRTDDGRVAEGILALYTFEEDSGTIVHDVSGVAPALDLTIAHPSRVRWGEGYLKIRRSTVIRSDGPASKIVAGALATGALTVEAWITPSRDGDRAGDDGPECDDDDGGIARIVSNAQSQNPKRRNFSLDQEERRYACRVRTTATDNQIRPYVRTRNRIVHSRLTHVLYTRSPEGVAVLYVDGVELTRKQIPGDLSTWNPSYPLSLANEVSRNRPWYGKLHLVALYNRALDSTEVLRNFAAGADPGSGGAVPLITDMEEDDDSGLPAEFTLGQNYPNPFNPVTTITFAVPGTSARTLHATSLQVFDVLGRPVATLVDDTRAPGIYSVTFDASHLASGVYLYRLTMDGFTATRRMMLLK